MTKIIIDSLVILLLWILHLTFFSQLTTLIFLNLPLLYLLLRIAFSYQKNLWWLVILIGLLNESYSTYYYGTYLLIYLIVAWLAYIILYYFFTNRTLLSLGAGVIISSIVFKFIQLIMVYFDSNVSIDLLWFYMQKLFIAAFIESIILIVLIIILNFFTAKKYV
jgi:hypothetical protein